MNWFISPMTRRAAIFGGAILLVLGCGAALQAAAAEAGPFSELSGAWSGTGKVRTEKTTERIRCHATYRVADSGGHAGKLQLACKSDSYSFDLVGDFEADKSNQITGRWTERSRSIGGTVIGRARGDRIQIHVESSAFAADLVMVTRQSRQAVSIDSHGGGQVVKASIQLRRN